MIVTTMSDQGYEMYGKRSVQSWLDHTHFNITIYYENEPFAEFVDNDRVKQKNFYEIEDAKHFLEQIGKNPTFKGQVNNQYNYLFDVFKFCRKVFVVTDYALNYDSNFTQHDERFMWLDADVIATAKVPEDFMDIVLKDDYVAFLGRQWSYSECGFMAFNPQHSINAIFMNLYRNMYSNGTFVSLKYWTDCHVFDVVRTALGVAENDLSAHLASSHPFIESLLGEYFDHLKGPNRKRLGYSPEKMEKTA